MPKYYVTSGELKITIDRPNPTAAVHDAFTTHAPTCRHLGDAVQCNETGENIYADTVFFSTAAVLRDTGLDTLFVSPETIG